MQVITWHCDCPLPLLQVVVPGMQQLYDLYSFNVIPQIGRCVDGGLGRLESCTLQFGFSRKGACLLRTRSCELQSLCRELCCQTQAQRRAAHAYGPSPPCTHCRVVANDAASYQYLVESIRMFPDQETWAGVSTAVLFWACWAGAPACCVENAQMECYSTQSLRCGRRLAPCNFTLRCLLLCRR